MKILVRVLLVGGLVLGGLASLQTEPVARRLNGITLLPLPRPASAQTAELARYFPETGHNVPGVFLAFFDRRGGLATFGYPITEEFVDPLTGLLVQYFQNARMEWHPDNPEPYRVQLGLIGDLLGKGQPPLPASQIPAPSNPNCQYFRETGHSVCYQFRQAFWARGGLTVFGYPIAEFDLENGRIVQYFQRARMEWHPERPGDLKVSPGPVGLAQFEAAGYSSSLLSPAKPLNAQLQIVTDLHLVASVLRPVMQPNGQQTVILQVLNQTDQPLEGATVRLELKAGTGASLWRRTLPLTDSRGLTRLAFDVVGGRPGETFLLQFTVTAGGVTRTLNSSFLIWY